MTRRQPAMCQRTLYAPRWQRNPHRVCDNPARYLYAPPGMTIHLCKRHAKAVKFKHCTPISAEQFTVHDMPLGAFGEPHE